MDVSIPNFGVQEMVFFPEVTHEVIPGAPEFKDPKTEVVLYPPALKNGNVIYPYINAAN